MGRKLTVLSVGVPTLCLVCQVFIFSRSEVTPGEYECWGHFAEPWGLKAYVTWMTVAVFLLPALIITICQVRTVRDSHRVAHKQTTTTSHHNEACGMNEILLRFPEGPRWQTSFDNSSGTAVYGMLHPMACRHSGLPLISPTGLFWEGYFQGLAISPN